MNIDKLAGVFMVGFWIGMLTFFMVFLMLCSDKPTEIQSNKIIQPEKRLTTDGKTVDTLYIYKQ
jgi:hypothetical protein